MAARFTPARHKRRIIGLFRAFEFGTGRAFVPSQKEDTRMEMFLTIICISLFLFAIMALAFLAATRSERTTPPASLKPDVATHLPPARFFSDYTVSPTVTQTPFPIEALLLQIDNHVRLEHAAAESFLFAPSPALLHNKTTSQLVN
jgi:hypothetical protein